jgi:hypothetical protein
LADSLWSGENDIVTGLIFDGQFRGQLRESGRANEEIFMLAWKRMSTFTTVVFMFEQDSQQDWRVAT